MITMGIDQSFTSTGVVFLNDSSSVLHVEIISSDKNVDFFERAWIISQRINSLIEQYNPDHISMEGLAFGGVGNATRQLSGLQYTIMNGIRKVAGKECELIAPTTLKKFAFGKGKASKVEMYESLPQSVKTFFSVKEVKKTKGLYDVTDAYFLARYSWMKYESHS